MADNIIEEYWRAVVKRLQAEVQTFNRLIGHMGEMGHENELSLARVFTNLLPPSIGVGSGIIIDSAGNRSRQTDIIVFDNASQPKIMAQTTQMIYPIESVFMAIEIKTVLSAQHISDFVLKQQALAELVPDEGYPMPASALFSYSCISPSAQADSIAHLDRAVQPSAYCTISPGIVGRAGNNGFEVGFAALRS